MRPGLDAYTVHMTFNRADHDDPAEPVSVSTIILVERSDDPEHDEERASDLATSMLRPYLNNQANVKTCVVAMAEPAIWNRGPS